MPISMSATCSPSGIRGGRDGSTTAGLSLGLNCERRARHADDPSSYSARASSQALPAPEIGLAPRRISGPGGPARPAAGPVRRHPDRPTGTVGRTCSSLRSGAPPLTLAAMAASSPDAAADEERAEVL